MKITKRQLRKLIQKSVLNEVNWDDTPWSSRDQMDREVRLEELLEELHRLIEPIKSKIVDEILGGGEEIINALADVDSAGMLEDQLKIATTILDFFNIEHEQLVEEYTSENY